MHWFKLVLLGLENYISALHVDNKYIQDKIFKEMLVISCRRYSHLIIELVYSIVVCNNFCFWSISFSTLCFHSTWKRFVFFGIIKYITSWHLIWVITFFDHVQPKCKYNLFFVRYFNFISVISEYTIFVWYDLLTHLQILERDWQRQSHPFHISWISRIVMPTK